MQTTRQIIVDVVKAAPYVRPHLSSRARWMLYEPVEYKTAEYMLRVITGLVEGVYGGYIGGQFIDTMANVISGQLLDAYSRAWLDEGFTGDIPDYLDAAYQDDVLRHYDFVDQYYRDIVDARIDGTPIGGLLARAQLWAQRWTEAYNNAVRLIATANGEKLMWQLGATEEHCVFCSQYNGIVAFASEWNTLDIKPQNAPNPALTGGSDGCGGWRCDCSLETTDKRRSPNAYGRLEEILMARA